MKQNTTSWQHVQDQKRYKNTSPLEQRCTFPNTMANINHPLIDILHDINESLSSHVTVMQQELEELQEDMIELEETLVEWCGSTDVVVKGKDSQDGIVGAGINPDSEGTDESDKSDHNTAPRK